MPKWDENQDRHYTIVGGGAVAEAVLQTASNLELIGAVTEALNAEGWKNLVPAYYDITLKYKGVRDEESIAMLDQILEDRIYDFGYVYGGWNSAGGGAGFCGSSGGGKGFIHVRQPIQDTPDSYTGHVVYGMAHEGRHERSGAEGVRRGGARCRDGLRQDAGALRSERRDAGARGAYRLGIFRLSYGRGIFCDAGRQGSGG
jgi:hypothetical protein